MIGDTLILGINDKQIQARLIREPDITGAEIVQYCKSIILSKQHLKTRNPEEEVDALRKNVKTF